MRESARRARARRPDPLRRGARAARHRRRDPLRRGHARGALPRPQRRRALRPRPDRADRAARAHRRAGDARPLSGRRSRPATGSSTGSEDGEITEFLEKPEPDQIDTDEINAGAYVLERSVLDLIPPDRAVSIEREVFPQLVGDGPLRAPARGLLDRHRHARALPGGELGHPRGPGRDRDRRASTTDGVLVGGGRRGRSLRASSGPPALVGAGSRDRRRRRRSSARARARPGCDRRGRDVEGSCCSAIAVGERRDGRAARSSARRASRWSAAAPSAAR